MPFRENDKAIYIQIADGICDRVMSGALNPGDRIPSVREYAATVGVNANTVMKSYEYLSMKEIIFNRRGIGFFIAPGAIEIICQERKEIFFSGEAEYFFGRMASIGLTPEEVAALYSSYIEKNSRQ